jgi:hypothetical protein
MDNTSLRSSILELVRLYVAAEYGNLRIEAEGLIESELSVEEKKSLKDTNIFYSHKMDDPPCKDHEDRWCNTVEEALDCRHMITLMDHVFRQIKEDDRFFEKAVMLFWYVHGSAYERWEDTFDYGCIACRLHLGRSIAESARNKTGNPAQKLVLQILKDLSAQVHHGLYVENAMISNNPEAFSYHAERHSYYSNKIISDSGNLRHEAGQEDDGREFINGFVSCIIGYLQPLQRYMEALCIYGLAMKARREDTGSFIRQYEENFSLIKATCRELENAGNLESSSELRAHIRCLEEHHKAISGASPVHLMQVDGRLMFGFYQDHGQSVSGSRGFFEKLTTRLLKQVGKDFGPLVLRNVTEDPPPDILESSIGQENFINICLVFDDIEVREPSTDSHSLGRLIATLTPRLFHFSLGVGMLSFECSISEVNVSEFYALKHLASPHSGQYDVFAAGSGETKRMKESRLADIPEKIIDEYCRISRGSYESGTDKDKPDADTWIEVEQSWFTHFEIYGIRDSGGELYTYERLEKHYEWPGIVCYQRADRASLDDWISIDVPSLSLNNLAQIRAHRGDVFVISENHSLCYLPDDPRFVVLQYGETAKWVFLIRTLLLFCLRQSHEENTKLKDEVSRLNKAVLAGRAKKKLTKADLEAQCDALVEKQTRLQWQRTLTIGILEHANSIMTSQYADHGLLLKRAFHETGITRMVEQLQEMLQHLVSIQEGFSVVLEDIQARRVKRNNERLSFFMSLLAIIQIVQSYDVVYNIFISDESLKSPRYWFQFLALSLSCVILVAVTYHRLWDFLKYCLKKSGIKKKG